MADWPRHTGRQAPAHWHTGPAGRLADRPQLEDWQAPGPRSLASLGNDAHSRSLTSTSSGPRPFLLSSILGYYRPCPPGGPRASMPRARPWSLAGPGLGPALLGPGLCSCDHEPRWGGCWQDRGHDWRLPPGSAAKPPSSLPPPSSGQYQLGPGPRCRGEGGRG